MVAIIIGNVKLLLCPDLSLDQEQGQDARPGVPEVQDAEN